MDSGRYDLPRDVRYRGTENVGAHACARRQRSDDTVGLKPESHYLGSEQDLAIAVNDSLGL
jgi:hypothetical protein